MKETLVLEFPQLHPVGSLKSYQLVRPASKISYPFMEEWSHLRTSKIYVLDKWKPPSLRSGLAILHLYPRRWEDGPRFYTISLNPTGATPPKPSHVEQTADSLPPTEEFDSMVVVDAIGVALLKSPQFSDSRQALNILFYGVGEDGRLLTPDGKDYEHFFPHGGLPTPLDFVSGTALLNSRNVAPKPETQVIEIISFDFQNSERHTPDS
ncbi:hypothetical protein DL93DRAFT_377187 [Clavulina sp. PMI_390]|nr:hypothetical protein DL93DRAFT_377187 [Clavulina sp. PMI_390]